MLSKSTETYLERTRTYVTLLPRDTDATFIDSNDDVFNSTSWRWGRWILFVLFVAGVLLLIICTARVNRRRRALGEAPIRGTAWMTPPSYRQSEQQYHGTTQAHVEDFVPEYTENVADNDLGYYDERGEFHPNGKVEYIPPPVLAEDNYPEQYQGQHDEEGVDFMARPSPAVTRRPTELLPFNLPTPNPNTSANHFSNLQSPSAQSGATTETMDTIDTRSTNPSIRKG